MNYTKYKKTDLTLFKHNFIILSRNKKKRYENYAMLSTWNTHSLSQLEISQRDIINNTINEGREWSIVWALHCDIINNTINEGREGLFCWFYIVM